MSIIFNTIHHHYKNLLIYFYIIIGMEEKMTTIEQDIEKAKSIINEQNKFIPNYGILDKIEPFATKNIKEILTKYNLKGKKILTLLSSGDQIIDMCLNGANNITSFDINHLTKYYYNLKKAALLSNITREQFLEYFCYYHYPYYNGINKQSFHPEMFEKICQYLDEESYKFWSSLYDEYNHLQIRNGKSLFLGNELHYKILTNTIDYLNNDTNFYKTKERVKDLNFSFINEDARNLPNISIEHYDFIYLSNIIEYLLKTYLCSINENQNQLDKLQELKDLLITYTNLLNKDGILIANYRSKTFNKNKNNYILEQFLSLIFDDNIFSSIEIDSIEKIKRKGYCKENINLNDNCLIYRKK